MIKNYAPDYYVRIITSSGEINLTNVISISTNKDVNADTGNFVINLNYDQVFYNKGFQNTSTYNQNSIFFRIKPMDYIEIYLSRDGGRFGIYDANGYLKGFEQNKELDIVQRILNPHLILCGFVDGINNNFGLSENSTSNSISIRGKCLAKFLSVHHLFFNFPFSNLFVKQSKGAIGLVGLRAHEAIDNILTNFCIGIFTNDVAETKQSQLDEMQKINSKALSSKDHMVIWQDTKTGKSVQQIKHNVVPSFNYVYWGINPESARKANVSESEITEQNNYYDWGRMDYSESKNRNILNVTAESPVLNILKQGAQLPFNEFFIDEIGNVVLRKSLDAWDYSKNTSASMVISNIELEEGDIRNWNFSISDDELKTIVIDVPIASIFGSQPIMAGAIGVAPLADVTAQTLLSGDKSKTSGEQSKQTLSQIQKDKSNLQKTFENILSQQGKHLDEYNLSTEQGILKFWQKFGLRPFQINDIYSDTFSSFYQSAWSLFQKYSNYWWKGSITVKGDSKYKVGQKGKIKNFALDLQGDLRDFNFYIQGVSHNFSWGSDWITTLTFTRGEIEGTQSSQTLQVKKTNE